MAQEHGDGRAARTEGELLDLLDAVFSTGREATGFFVDRSGHAAFRSARPDESLVDLLDRGVLGSSPGGRGLDLGCGNARNTLYLQMHRYAMDALDPSQEALDRARSRQDQFEYHVGCDLGVRYHCGDVFGPVGAALTGPYDLIYDSGYFHYLPPHRRPGYLALVERLLAPGGHLALLCAGPDGDGGHARVPDAQLYRDGTLHGGLGYTAADLRRIFVDGPLPLVELQLRRMHDESGPDPRRFGLPGLWTALFRRPEQ
ncbi:class I SAM-dependent methyltransferase [Kitasatospora sp. NPDC058965]|uniref:class I SAM-dependent methyltransferase n=1 Tax=Kitasatospora sp. NPDC058965 TaxID=3346682 RepID=UPI0036C82378